MTKTQSFLAHVAAIVAHLAPVLVALEQAPGSIGRYAALAVTALVSLGLIKLDMPKPAASSQAGFGRNDVLLFLGALGVFAGVGCAALTKAEKSPAFVDAVTFIRKGDADAVKFCAGLPAFKATGLVPSAVAKDLDVACADLAKANATTVTVIVSSPAGSGSASVGLAGAPSAQ